MLTDTQYRTAKPKEKLYRFNDFNGLDLEMKPMAKRRGAIGLNSTVNPACVSPQRGVLKALKRSFCLFVSFKSKDNKAEPKPVADHAHRTWFSIINKIP